jgi:hypothetical protein
LTVIAPLNVPTTVPVPPVGAVCVTVIVSVPPIIDPVPVAVARISPKLIFVGVFCVDGVAPLKTSVVELAPLVKTRVFVPLPVITAPPAQATQVNTPDVLNVTLSAFAAEAVSASSPATSAVISELLRIFFISDLTPFGFPFLRTH